MFSCLNNIKNSNFLNSILEIPANDILQIDILLGLYSLSRESAKPSDLFTEMKIIFL